LNDQITKKEEEISEIEQNPTLAQRMAVRKGVGSVLLVPILAVVTAFIIGGIVIAFSSLDVLAAWGKFFQSPLEALKISWKTVFEAYSSLIRGAFGSPKEMVEALRIYQQTGDDKAILEAFRAVSESLVISTPYIFAGLAVALGFRGGLFNIGAEGQLFVGALAAAYIGYAVKGLPAYIHLPLALLAGILAAAIWGAIPGYLKAKTGAHEVINTIMMNYVAYRLTDFMLSGPMARPDHLPITPEIAKSAYLPIFYKNPVRLHWGFILALVMAYLVYWFLWKTPIGVEIRMVGANPRAARYAGVKMSLIMVLTMALSGALAGMAGANQILGVDHRLVRSFSTGYGFDSIALALLGNSHPLGVVLASLMFGFLRGGAARMQSIAGIPVEIIGIIQAMVIIFIAAPEIIRSIYHIKKSHEEEKIFQRGWG
jgi:ABC-type uncharacterized transport system permease subunit